MSKIMQALRSFRYDDAELADLLIVAGASIEEAHKIMACLEDYILASLSASSPTDIDRKFAIYAFSRNSNNEYTHADGALFLARDFIFPQALEAYLKGCEEYCDQAQIDAVRLMAQRVNTHQYALGTKIPDVEPGVEQSRVWRPNL